jgi:hypothetical protein
VQELDAKFERSGYSATAPPSPSTRFREIPFAQGGALSGNTRYSSIDDRARATPRYRSSSTAQWVNSIVTLAAASCPTAPYLRRESAHDAKMPSTPEPGHTRQLSRRKSDARCQYRTPTCAIMRRFDELHLNIWSSPSPVRGCCETCWPPRGAKSAVGMSAAGISTTTTAADRIRVLTASHLLQLAALRRRNQVSGSTWRREKSVQPTGTTSAGSPKFARTCAHVWIPAH